jgi:uncharacterized protein YkwD
MSDRPDLSTVLNTRVARFLAAVAVVLAAAVVVPTLTSRPTRDTQALETAQAKDQRDGAGSSPADTPIGITDDAVVPAGDEVPSDEGTPPATTAKGSKSTGSNGTSTTLAQRGTGTTAGSNTTTTAADVATTASTTPAATTPSGSCTRAASAENEIAGSFESYRDSLPGPDGGPVGAMTRSAKLDKVAFDWACQMANDQAMRHNPEGPAQILAACGGCTATAENVAYDNSAGHAWAGWIAEPPATRNHRGNIEDPRGGTYGIGVARASNGVLYIVHDFAH